MVSEQQTAIAESLVEAGLEKPRRYAPYELMRLARLRPSYPIKNPHESLRGDLKLLEQINNTCQELQAALPKPDLK